MSKRRVPRVVAFATVPMRAVLVEVPPIVPYAMREDVEARLRSVGFDVFFFSDADVGAFARGTGWSTWLRERGYSPESAESVHFDRQPGHVDQPAMILGALRETR